MKKPLTKRQFLRFSALSLSPLALGRQHPSTLAAGRHAKDNRPNIIFLMSDQQRWDCVGRINPAVKTPALDSLARDGIFFDQATCQGPTCVPIILSGTAVPESLKGTIDHRPAELLDLMPTILNAAALPPDPAKPGRDLLAPPVKSAAFCELHTRRERPAYMWRKNHYKLILVMDKKRAADGFDTADILAGELYDLKNDPAEWNNLFSDDKYAPVRRRMTAALINHLQKYAAQKGVQNVQI